MIGGRVLLPAKPQLQGLRKGKRIVCVYFRVCVCLYIAPVVKSTSYSECGNFTEHITIPLHTTSSNTQAEGFLEFIPKDS